MFSHVMLGANDIEESKQFYDQTLAALGARPGKLSLNHDGHTLSLIHISEPTRQAEISYAVFCLKKKKKKNNITNNSIIQYKHTPNIPS